MPATAWNRIKDIATNGKEREMEITTKTVEVTPEMAEKWLGRNVQNRPLRQTTVLYYAREMRNGRWVLNGDPIRFDWNGNLMDGQHRLAAIIESGEPQEMLIMSGLDPTTFYSIDGGARRHIGDHLSLKGEKSAKTLGAAVKLVRLSERNDLWSTNALDKRVSPKESLDCLERHPALRDSLEFSKIRPRYLPASVITFCHYAFAQKDADLADWFWEAFGTGVGLRMDEPVYHLRERMIQENMDPKRSMDRRHKLAYTIKAWNKTRAGDRIKRLTWWPDREGWPEIE